eukprot:363440-Chlamydomonas_euryale.AAC.2
MDGPTDWRTDQPTDEWDDTDWHGLTGERTDGWTHARIDRSVDGHVWMDRCMDAPPVQGPQAPGPATPPHCTRHRHLALTHLIQRRRDVVLARVG